MSEDYKQKMLEKLQDAISELLLQVQAGEISEEDFQRELDIGKVLLELIKIAADRSQLARCRHHAPRGASAMGCDADREMAGSMPQSRCRRDTHAGCRDARDHIVCWPRKLAHMDAPLKPHQ